MSKKLLHDSLLIRLIAVGYPVPVWCVRVGWEGGRVCGPGPTLTVSIIRQPRDNRPEGINRGEERGWGLHRTNCTFNYSVFFFSKKPNHISFVCLPTYSLSHAGARENTLGAYATRKERCWLFWTHTPGSTVSTCRTRWPLTCIS